MDFDHATLLLLAIVGCIVRSSNAIPGPIDLSQALLDKSRYPMIKGYFRVEAQIIKMLNPRGTTWNYAPCDLVPLVCDPKIDAAID